MALEFYKCLPVDKGKSWTITLIGDADTNEMDWIRLRGKDLDMPKPKQPEGFKVQSSVGAQYKNAIHELEKIADGFRAELAAIDEPAEDLTLPRIPTKDFHESLAKVEEMKKEFPIKGASEIV